VAKGFGAAWSAVELHGGPKRLIEIRRGRHDFGWRISGEVSPRSSIQSEISVEIKTRAGTSSLCESGWHPYISKMGLSCLLLTSDPALLQMMRHSCIAAEVDLELRTDAASVIELSARRHSMAS